MNEVLAVIVTLTWGTCVFVFATSAVLSLLFGIFANEDYHLRMGGLAASLISTAILVALFASQIIERII